MQVKPGDMAIIISSLTEDTSFLIGATVVVGELNGEYNEEYPSWGPWYSVEHPNLVAQPSFRLMRIDPDEAITEDETKEVAA